MKEIDIQKKLWIAYRDSSFCMIPNCWELHTDESDLFQIRKSGICVNYEIKLSQSDFRSDFKTKNFHKFMLRNWQNKFLDSEDIRQYPHYRMPNYYYFVFPECIYPFTSKYFDYDYFGIITVGQSGVRIIKKAPKLLKRNKYKEMANSKKRRADNQPYTIIRSLYNKYWYSLS